MSVSLDDIWAEPLEKDPSPPRASTADNEGDDSGDDMSRPSKRQRSALFLDDPDEMEENDNNATRSVHPDVDALFQEAEDDAGTSSKPFDIEAYRLEAQRRAEKEVNIPSSSYPRHAIQSSSPPPEGANEKDDDKDESGKGNGKRAIPKIDENRLLAMDGFPALIRQIKDFKPKGKGQEQADLNRLIGIYQFWSHRMMPKWTFSDTIDRVEKVCRTKRMTVAVSAWKDEFNGTIHGQRVAQDGNDDAQNESDDETNARSSHALPAASSSPSHSRASSSAPADVSRSPTRPPSSASGSLFLEDENDLFDFAGISGGDSSNTSGFLSRPPAGEVDESDMWAELEADPTAFDDPPPQSNSRPPAYSFKPPSKDADDDEAMWDILNEIEMEQATEKNKEPSAPTHRNMENSNLSEAAPQIQVSDSTISSDKRLPISEDPDWDDMYA